MLKRESSDAVTEEFVEAKVRRVASDCDDQKVNAEGGPAGQLSSGDVGTLPSSSEADTTCEVCEGDGASNSVGSSVPSSVQAESCAVAARQVPTLELQCGHGAASESTAKPAAGPKFKKFVRFAQGPIESSPDGHPVSEGTTMVARAPCPYNLFTPVKPIEALTKHSLTAMERELGDDFRTENALSLVRLKRRVCSSQLACFPPSRSLSFASTCAPREIWVPSSCICTFQPGALAAVWNHPLETDSTPICDYVLKI